MFLSGGQGCMLRQGCLFFFLILLSTTTSWSQEIEVEADVALAIPQKTYDAAKKAFDIATAWGEVKTSYLAIIDFNLPSTAKRFWLIDTATSKVLFNDFVAHGKASGDNYAKTFSNILGSNTSSLGGFRSTEIYWGKHGISLRLEGLEPGINDQAEARDIVIHGADYVSQDFINKNGRLGRSLGCPALNFSISEKVIRTLDRGSFVFAYFDDASYFASSKYFVKTP